jgi:SagB-type dehydrogenase family enzyme
MRGPKLSNGRWYMNRRFFLRRVAALSLGLAAMGRIGISWAKGLPSDPDGSAAGAPGPDVFALPAFEKNNEFPLDKALLERRSVRSFDPGRKLSREELSRLLWAADGANRANGRRTAPSARGNYPVDILAALPEGVYLFEPREHRMKKLISEDIRTMIPKQDGLDKAAMIVLYVVNTNKTSRRMEWADLEIGCIGQNLFLEATAMGLASCIFAYAHMGKASKAIGLKRNQELRMAQAVGAAK